MKYQVIKTYGNETGHSCAFRQWRADSHCNLIHGYALGFEITFEAETLDDRNWVIDFGDLGTLKKFLKEMYSTNDVSNLGVIAQQDKFSNVTYIQVNHYWWLAEELSHYSNSSKRTWREL